MCATEGFSGVKRLMRGGGLGPVKELEASAVALCLCGTFQDFGFWRDKLL